MERSRYVAVCGASDPDPEQRELAREVGRRLAEAGAVVLCGGLGGVMEAAADAVVAIGGGWGTLSEIGLARRRDRPVVSVAGWELEGVPVAISAEEAVRAALGDH